ncbi:MAG: MarR family transcriptional regulator [Candidatus Micrarchaeota archaeon]
MAANALAFSQEIHIQISSAGFAQVEHQILPQSGEEIRVTLLDSKAAEISILADGQAILFETNGEEVSIANPNNASEILLRYLSPSLTGKNREKWTLDLSNISPTVSRIEVALPRESKITRFEPLANVSLQNQGLLAEWDQFALSSRHVLLEYELLPQKPAIDFSWLLAVAIVLVLAAGFFWMRAKKIPPKTVQVQASATPVSDAKTEICRTLCEKEKKIMELVLETDGLTQKQLNQKTGYSKATLSRTLKNLEQKQLLRLVQDGYSNKVFLTEWFKNK